MTDLALAPADAPAPAAGRRRGGRTRQQNRNPTPAPSPIRRWRADPAPVAFVLQRFGSPARRPGGSDICSERREPTSGAMFLGSRVDDALTLYYRRILDHGERLDLAQVKDAYRDLWHTELQAEEQQLGIDWSDIHQHEAFELGLQALELTFEQLVPKLGEPVAVQRRVEFTLAPGLTEWTIVCYLDLETRASAERRAARPGRRLQGQGHARSASRRPTATRRPACTSPAAGSRADPPRSSRSLRSRSPAAQRRQMSATLVDHPANGRAAARQRSHGSRSPRGRSTPATERSLGVPFVSGLSSWRAG